MSTARGILIPVIAPGELEAGFQPDRRGVANRRELADFLAEPAVHVLDVTAGTASRFGRIFARLRTAGTPIPITDVRIAAAAMECGGHLLTFDRDFDRIPGLETTIVQA